ncbi:MAG: Fic family protein [Rothia sp. (in: high G+C Gram-positive bacteria)]|nr:Fic family protein [Rothia sp. (in: high G+C Gram-positive bacteria)]
MTIENKLGITDSAELARVEEKLSKQRALELFESGALELLEAGTTATLQEIHRVLFGDIYDFAGEIRQVNIAKGGFRFAPVMYLQAALAHVDTMTQQTYEQIIEKYVEMNIAHPFREGNGRAMRLWLDCILRAQLGQVVDWIAVDKEDYLLAMERSPIRDTEIKVVLKAALTDRTNDRLLFMKGVDASYYYEGYYTYSTTDLDQQKEGTP